MAHKYSGGRPPDHVCRSGLFYVYELGDETGKTFYVGKGKYDRLHCHEADARRGSQSAPSWKIRETWERGFAITKRIVLVTESELEALAEETALIEKYGPENLTNVLGNPEAMAAISGGNKLHPSTVSRIVELRNSGLKIREIANETGVSVATIQKYTPRTGRTKWNDRAAVVASGLVKLTADQMCVLSSSGIPLREIAGYAGIGSPAVRKIILDSGGKLRSRGRPIPFENGAIEKILKDLEDLGTSAPNTPDV